MADHAAIDQQSAAPKKQTSQVSETRGLGSQIEIRLVYRVRLTLQRNTLQFVRVKTIIRLNKIILREQVTQHISILFL